MKQSTGISSTTILFLIFLVLKLCGVIAWSWWWVFAPFWIPAAVVVAIILFGLGLGIYSKAKAPARKGYDIKDVP